MTCPRFRIFVAVAIIAGFCLSAQSEGYVQTFELEDGGSGAIDWSENGLVTAQGIGFPAGNEAFPNQRQVNACVAARVVAQRRLLEIIEGVSVYGGATLEGKGLVEDVIRSNVQGVLIGAVVLDGSQQWDAENSVCTLTMAAPLANVREAIPPLGLTDDGELILVDDERSVPGDVDDERDTSPTDRSTEASIVANDDTFTATDDGVVAHTVLANDVWPQHEPVTVELAEPASGGELTLNTNGTFSFRATETSPYEVRFAYRIGVGDATSNVAYVTIRSHDMASSEDVPADSAEETAADQPQSPEVDDGGPGAETPQPIVPSEERDGPTDATPSPTAIDDPYVVASGQTIQLDILANDSSASGGPLAVTDYTLPQHGILTLFSDGTGTYAHRGGAATADSFGYTASDASGASDLAAVLISVIPSEPGIGGPDEPSEPQVQEQPRAPQAQPEFTGTLPTGIVLDASGRSLVTSVRISITSSSGIVLADNVEAHYETSVDTAVWLNSVRDEPIVMPVFELAENFVDIRLDAEQSEIFVALISQRDYVGEHRIVVVGGD